MMSLGGGVDSSTTGLLTMIINHTPELLVLILMSVLGVFLVKRLFKKYKGEFLRAGFSGVDMGKASRPTLPEAQGVLCGVVFLSIMFLFIPVPSWRFLLGRYNLFPSWISETSTQFIDQQSLFFKSQLIKFLAGLLSICCMLFLGFADDALNMPWRHKIVFPTVASLPLLMVYLANEGGTRVVLPIMLRHQLGDSINIGLFYYVYMGLLAVFCTNSINIYAGINGLEVGQTLVIAVSLLIFNLIELHGQFWEVHLFSLYFLIPFLAVCWSLYGINRYPAQAFVGDTFCYFAGMTFAVVGILGHFSKTLMLFFLPQIINFLYSTPQLFGLIPCPRHRLPHFNPSDGLLHPSYVRFHPKSLSRMGQFTLSLITRIGLIKCKTCPVYESDMHNQHTSGDQMTKSSSSSHLGDGDQEVKNTASSNTVLSPKEPEEEIIEINNLTLINMMLRFCGPKAEIDATHSLLILQICCSCLAFFIRYPLAWFFYGFS